MGVDYTTNLLINHVTKVQSGELTNWKGTGNSHIISISKDRINIFNEFTKMETTINNFEYFLLILQDWKKLINSRENT